MMEKTVELLKMMKNNTDVLAQELMQAHNMALALRNAEATDFEAVRSHTVGAEFKLDSIMESDISKMFVSISQAMYAFMKIMSGLEAIEQTEGAMGIHKKFMGSIERELSYLIGELNTLKRIAAKTR